MSEVTWGEIAGLLLILLPLVVFLWPAFRKKNRDPE